MCVTVYNSPTKIRSRIYRSPRKPRLPRNIIRSTRVNLNLHWTALEKSSGFSGDVDVGGAKRVGNSETKPSRSRTIDEEVALLAPDFTDLVAIDDFFNLNVKEMYERMIV